MLSIILTGVHMKIISASENVLSIEVSATSTTPSFIARFVSSGFLVYAIILRLGILFFNALAMEPPINPKPIKPIQFIISSISIYLNKVLLKIYNIPYIIVEFLNMIQGKI